MSNEILSHTERGVTTVTLNRLDRKNSITAAMYGALADALAAAQADEAVRVVVFQGHETVFSAGNDIGDFLDNPPAQPNDEVTMPILLKAGAGPVTIEPLACFGVARMEITDAARRDSTLERLGWSQWSDYLR